MSAIDQTILNELHKLTETDQHQVLDFIRYLQQPTYTALELLKLSPELRQHYIAKSFALAQNEDFEIFEAYSEEDLDDFA